MADIGPHTLALAAMIALASYELPFAVSESQSRLDYVRELLKKSRIEFGWDWSARAWGYCREFEELGMTSLVLGPLHIQFDWDI